MKNNSLREYGQKHSKISPVGVASLRIHPDGAISNGLFILEKLKSAKEAVRALSNMGWIIQGDVARFRAQEASK